MPNVPAPAQVFISYAHADNPAFDQDTRGWVSNFVDHLQKAVGMRSGGGRVTCWMDHRLEPQRAVDAALRNRILDSQCIVAFISPRYLESRWCRKEMATFVDLVGGGVANDRVFLVELLPTDRLQWHRGIQSITAVKFWDSTIDQPEPIILGWPAPNPKGDRPYWTGLNRLADILARQIKTISPGESASPRSTPVSVPTAEARRVWIAEPTDDVLERWETLATALRDLGHRVAPGEPRRYPRGQEIAFRTAVDDDLATAHVLVQLFGSDPGDKPSWSDLRFVELQAAAAGAEARRRSLPLLVWRSSDIELDRIADPAYRAVLTGATACGPEEFLRQVLRCLASPAPSLEAPAQADGSVSVVVNADRPDRDLGKRVRDMLFALDVDATLVAEPVPTQLPAQYLHDLEMQLADSNGLVIVYGAVQPSWVQAQHALARKTLALRRKGIWGALLDGPPQEKPDHEVRSRNLMLLDCRGGVTAEPLKRFVDLLKQDAARV